MPTANLNNAASSVDTGMESIVIVRNLDAVRGGRTLDVTGFAPTVIQAGHLIIKETATGNYKPMPVTMAGDVATDYAALPVGHTYEGVLIAGILTAKPFAGILTNGTVNPDASPFAPPAGAITALTNIQFRGD